MSDKDTVKSRRVVPGQPSLAEQLAAGKAHNTLVFYWRTDRASLPKLGTCIAETSEFIIVRDSASALEVACNKSDYKVSNVLADIHKSIAEYFQAHETEVGEGGGGVEFSDKECNEVLDFLKLALKYEIKSK